MNDGLKLLAVITHNLATVQGLGIYALRYTKSICSASKAALVMLATTLTSCALVWGQPADAGKLQHAPAVLSDGCLGSRALLAQAFGADAWQAVLDLPAVLLIQPGGCAADSA